MREMNFLNEVADRYPKAISFAPGRPHERFFAYLDPARLIERYTSYLRDERGLAEADTRRVLFQYGASAGIINELVAGMLRADEGIDVEPSAVVITVGCQEALFLTLRGLCPAPEDVALYFEPGYLGFTGAAEVLKVPVIGVPECATGLDLVGLARVVAEVRAGGRRPRLLYVIPDHANPSGAVLSIADRERLLEFAAREDILLLEDNPYSFTSEPMRQPTLKALDKDRRVVYAGTFAKVCLPGVRVGYAVADQLVGPERTYLAAELATIKSMVTVNTSPVDQAVIGGIILDNGGALGRLLRPRSSFYQENLRVLSAELATGFRDRSTVTWNNPSGGFFVVLTVPFVADMAALRVSAEEHGVLWTPMSYFYRDGGHRRIRLSISSLDPDEIVVGVRRLAAFVANMVGDNEEERP